MFEITEEQELELRMSHSDYTLDSLLADNDYEKYICEIVLENYDPDPPMNKFYLRSVFPSKDKVYALVESGYFWLFTNFRNELEPTSFHVRTGCTYTSIKLNATQISKIDKIRFDVKNETCRFYQGETRMFILENEYE